MLQRGATFERYTVLEMLGRGGMGEVYAVYDSKLDRKVALKVLRHTKEDYALRLAREAQAMARLSHPNVVAVFDTGSVDGRVCVAMEFVQGQTLRAWQRARIRPWAEILRMYIDAGQGLAAAHAAGLVHRDFKPDNVLVSEAGVVKVTDFGLARAVTSATTPWTPSGDAVSFPSTSSPVVDVPPNASSPAMEDSSHAPVLTSAVTESGELLGTPGYMAPEQCLQEEIDERTDQFAFCVALYEAVYGQKPFPSDVTESVQAMLADQVKAPPKGTKVPAHIHRALLRGLASNKSDRHPRMLALLEELSREPTKRRRQVAGAVAAVVAMAVGAVWLNRTIHERSSQLCAGSEAEASEVWNADVQGRIERAMLATNLPYAADVWRRTRGAIDAYMVGWTATHEQTCRATRIDGHQPEQVMIVRMACLGQRHEEVRALTKVLEAADGDVLSKAVQAAVALPSVETCKDVTSLLSIEPEPGDPASRSQLDSIRKGLATVRAEYEAGKYAPARAEAALLVERARRVGYHPVTGEALLWLAQAMAKVGVPRAQCIEQSQEAVAEADSGRDDLLRAEAASKTMDWYTSQGQFKEAEAWSAVIGSALRRTSSNGEKDYEIHRAEWLKEQCYLLFKQRQLDQAVRPCQEAWEILSKSAVSDSVVEMSVTVTGVYAALGRREEAERIATATDDKIIHTLGEEHPARLVSLNGRAYIAGLSFDYKTSGALALQAVRLGEKVAPGDRRTTVAQINACDALGRTGNASGGLPYCDLAIAGALKAFGADSDYTAEARSSKGTALLALERYPDAVAEYEETVRVFEKIGATKHPTVVGALGGIGRAQLAMGQPGRAVATLERALAIAETIELSTPNDKVIGAVVRFALARALASTGGAPDRIDHLTSASVEVYRSLGLEQQAREVADWADMRASSHR
jgi:tRNA A-37 threonylcarbamoyl transferase component Bud32/tetratricopeptide (TPR) repeat protein